MGGASVRSTDNTPTYPSTREVFTPDIDMYDAFWRKSYAGMNGQDSLWVLIGERQRQECLRRRYPRVRARANGTGADQQPHRPARAGAA
jgi:hypothetical protein